MVKRRRQLPTTDQATEAVFEDFIDYVFPDDEAPEDSPTPTTDTSKPLMTSKLLERARQWKQGMPS
jgi:hypothetical protein